MHKLLRVGGNCMAKSANKLTKTFFINTLIIVLTGFIIKILGLLNRILITRLLGTEGMSLYILAFPTIAFFLNLAAFSLNISTSKLISSSLITRQYSPKQILKKSLKISFFVSIIAIMILLAILRPLATKWLNNAKLFFPLLTTALLIPLVGISETLKGYFTGLKKMSIPSVATLLEQLARIAFGIGFIILFLPYGMVLATTFTLLALSFGEMISIIFLLFRLKKQPLIHFEKTSGETKAVLSITIPNTLSRLIGSFSFFLEPICYTGTLLALGYNNIAIETRYTIINAYAIPLMTMGSFLSFGIAQAVIPHISENFSLGKTESIRYLIRKCLAFSFIPGVLLSLVFYLFPLEFMKLIYNTSNGTAYLRPYVFLFVLYYLHPPVNAILQALGKAKMLFVTSTIFNVLRVIFILLFAKIPFIGLDSIFWAILVTMVLSSITNIIQLLVITKYRFDVRLIINSLLLIIGTLAFTTFLGHFFHFSFLIDVLFTSFFFIFFAFSLKIISIESLIRKNPRST